MKYEVLQQLELADFEESVSVLDDLQGALIADGVAEEWSDLMFDLSAVSAAELGLMLKAINEVEP